MNFAQIMNTRKMTSNTPAMSTGSTRSGSTNYIGFKMVKALVVLRVLNYNFNGIKIFRN